MGEREVEFVESDDPGSSTADEPAAPPARDRRWWLPRIGALVVVAAALATWLATRPDDTPPRNAAAASATPSASASASIDSSDSDFPIRRFDPGGTLYCLSGFPVTVDMTRTIQAELPTAKLAVSSTYQCSRVYGFDQDRKLVYQAITAHLPGGVSFDVEVVSSGPRVAGVPKSPRHDETRPGHTTLAVIATQSVSVHVWVSAYGAPSQRAPLRAMSKLADRLALHPPDLDGIGLRVQWRRGGPWSSR